MRYIMHNVEGLDLPRMYISELSMLVEGKIIKVEDKIKVRRGFVGGC